jgi:acetylornithine deacetylase/succinyl-diaminopimelate desuccinylase-like protein
MSEGKKRIMADVLGELDRYIEEHLAESLEDLRRLTAIPSVSSKHEGIAEAAEFVRNLLAGAGFAAKILPTSGHPVVYGDSDSDVSGNNGESGKTMLLYNHYDVQPAEPLDLWESPPFELTERDGRVYARGVSDDKGQLISRLAAIRAVRAVTGGLPERVKFLVEGEEEISSPSLEPFIEENRELLASDACVWEFGGVDPEGRPEVVLGLRGILYVEYRVRTLSRDAHSGNAHNFPNAAWRLVRALNTIQGHDGRILIPGFYDDVRGPTDTDLQLLAAAPSSEEFNREHFGVKEFINGHTGMDYKTAVYEPTANIAGIGAGWQGQGSKTVIPAYAMAKMDFRLVPDQNPDDLFAKLRKHLDEQGFGDVEVVKLGGERAAVTPGDDPFVQLTARLASEVYGKPAVIDPLIGGTGPVYPFRAFLHTPIVTLGPGDPLSNAHSPNESMSIEHFLLGTKHMARLLVEYGAQ